MVIDRAPLENPYCYRAENAVFAGDKIRQAIRHFSSFLGKYGN